MILKESYQEFLKDIEADIKPKIFFFIGVAMQYLPYFLWDYYEGSVVLLWLRALSAFTCFFIVFSELYKKQMGLLFFTYFMAITLSFVVTPCVVLLHTPHNVWLINLIISLCFVLLITNTKLAISSIIIGLILASMCFLLSTNIVQNIEKIDFSILLYSLFLMLV